MTVATPIAAYNPSPATLVRRVGRLVRSVTKRPKTTKREWQAVGAVLGWERALRLMSKEVTELGVAVQIGSGRVLVQDDGKPDGVTLDQLVKQVNEHGSTNTWTLVHNHPSAASFTPTDFGFLFAHDGFRGMFAVSREFTYVLKKRPRYNPRKVLQSLFKRRSLQGSSEFRRSLLLDANKARKTWDPDDLYRVAWGVGNLYLDRYYTYFASIALKGGNTEQVVLDTYRVHSHLAAILTADALSMDYERVETPDKLLDQTHPWPAGFEQVTQLLDAIRDSAPSYYSTPRSWQPTTRSSTWDDPAEEAAQRTAESGEPHSIFSMEEEEAEDAPDVTRRALLLDEIEADPEQFLLDNFDAEDQEEIVARQGGGSLAGAIAGWLVDNGDLEQSDLDKLRTRGF